MHVLSITSLMKSQFRTETNTGCLGLDQALEGELEIAQLLLEAGADKDRH